MSLMKFFEIIDSSFIGRYISNRKEILEATDPERIYVENIRSFFNLPYWFAELLCELAVRGGVYTKHYGIFCKNEECERLIKSVADIAEIPKKAKCITCELLERNCFEHEYSDKDIVIFYKLKK